MAARRPAGAARTPRRPHPLPVCPRHALWWTNLLSGKRCLDSCAEFHWPSSSSASLLVWHEVQVKRRKIGARCQGGNLFLLGLANDVPMVTNQAAQGRLPKHLGLVGLPPEQASAGGEREFLRQQAGPFLEATRDDDRVVQGQASVAWESMGRGSGVLAHLA